MPTRTRKRPVRTTVLRADDACEARNIPAVLRQARVPRAQFNTFVEVMKRQIRRDVQQGVVPPTVRSFEELHEYVDANMYGFREEGQTAHLYLPALAKRLDYGDQRHINVFNAAHGEVDRWLRTVGPVKPIRRSTQR